MPTREQLRAAIAQHGLASLTELEPALELVDSRPEETHEVGVSRFGGRPDLPPLTPWPSVGRAPIRFLGQIELDALRARFLGPSWPDRGLLSFFVDPSWAAPVASARVLFVDAPTVTLRPREAPSGLTTCAARLPQLSETWTLPELEELDAEEFPTIPAVHPCVGAEHREAYRQLRRQLRTFSTRLGGHPDPLQGGEQRFNAVMQRDGGRRFRYEDYAWTEEEALVAEMRGLVMLLQAPADPHTGADWASGMVHLWIPRADLEAQRFEAVWATREAD